MGRARLQMVRGLSGPTTAHARHVQLRARRRGWCLCMGLYAGRQSKFMKRIHFLSLTRAFSLLHLQGRVPGPYSPSGSQTLPPALLKCRPLRLLTLLRLLLVLLLQWQTQKRRRFP